MNARDRYFGKRFSLLGDSVSTLDLYSQPDFAAYYVGARKFEANVFSPEDTWWGQVIEYLGGELLVNNSFAGSTVVNRKSYYIQSYGCSDERTSSLGAEGLLPQVIMVYMGTNDWGANIKPCLSDGDEGREQYVFASAYDLMLEKLKKSYPDAEIWCFTLSTTLYSSCESYSFPYCYAGRHIEVYCRAIRQCCEKHGCRLIDLYDLGQPYDTIDGFHPNDVGMKSLAQSVISILEGQDC